MVDVQEWRDDPQRHLRAEVMTLLPGDLCLSASTPPDDLSPSTEWWTEMHQSLSILRTTPTTRVNMGQSGVTRRVREQLDIDVSIVNWETVHGDLHRANLPHTPCGLLDWELWGIEPACTDAATLYLYSLVAPEVAAMVREQFAEMLDSPDGRRARLHIAARLLRRSTFGDHPELVSPLRELIPRLDL